MGDPDFRFKAMSMRIRAMGPAGRAWADSVYRAPQANAPADKPGFFERHLGGINPVQAAGIIANPARLFTDTRKGQELVVGQNLVQAAHGEPYDPRWAAAEAGSAALVGGPIRTGVAALKGARALKRGAGASRETAEAYKARYDEMIVKRYVIPRLSDKKAKATLAKMVAKADKTSAEKKLLMSLARRQAARTLEIADIEIEVAGIGVEVPHIRELPRKAAMPLIRRNLRGLSNEKLREMRRREMPKWYRAEVEREWKRRGRK